MARSSICRAAAASPDTLNSLPESGEIRLQKPPKRVGQSPTRTCSSAASAPGDESFLTVDETFLGKNKKRLNAYYSTIGPGVNSQLSDSTIFSTPVTK